MAQQTIIHKGYYGTIKVDTKDYSLSGTILFLDEDISYTGETFAKLEEDFQKAVENHIAECVAKGEEPPFSE